MKACGPLPPAARTPSGTNRSPERSAYQGRLLLHFDYRRALLAEMLDTWERVSIDEVIERVKGGDAGLVARSA